MSFRHLIVADQPTLDRIAEQTSKEVVRDHATDRPLFAIDLETGDTWRFFSVESQPDPTDGIAHAVYGVRVDFLYLPHPLMTAYAWVVIGHDKPAEHVLPLIAACDALGVDEL